MRVLLPTWLLVPLVITAELVLIGLGTWQWQRLGQKQALEAAFVARTSGQPLAVAALDAMPEAERDFQLVGLAGRWDTEHLFRVSNRYRVDTRSGAALQGEDAIVPLLLDDGRGVLVDRGWYPVTERERVLGELRAQTRGEIHGLSRRHPDLSGGPLSSGAWSRFDAVSIAATLPYPTTGWVLIEGDMLAEDAALPSQLPATGWLPFKNDVPHLEYAMTWWGLALVLPVFVVARSFATRRGRPTAPDPLTSL